MPSGKQPPGFSFRGIVIGRDITDGLFRPCGIDSFLVSKDTTLSAVMVYALTIGSYLNEIAALVPDVCKVDIRDAMNLPPKAALPVRIYSFEERKQTTSQKQGTAEHGQSCGCIHHAIGKLVTLFHEWQKAQKCVQHQHNAAAHESGRNKTANIPNREVPEHAKYAHGYGFWRSGSWR